MGLTGVLAFGLAGGTAVALKVTGNIATVDADKALAQVDRPEVVVPDDPNAGAPLNIVLMGSDDRSGENAELGGKAEGQRSDTTMVMHISADRSRVEVVSIPRDSIVDIPKCPTSTPGKFSAAWGNTRFNAAFAQGVTKGHDVQSGALCTMTTIEQLTDVRMDGFIVVDFAGFLNMINALGGVTMCIPNDIYSAKANHLRLSAGNQTLDGATALQYARARTGEGLGNGSDTDRIGRQQEMMAAIAREVLSANLLTDSPKLVSFLNAVTSSLTMSSNFASLTGLPGLAYSLRNVRPDTISFMTVPWKSNPADPNTVVWTKDADTIWANMKNDVPLTTPAGGPTAAATPPATAGATGGADAAGTDAGSTDTGSATAAPPASADTATAPPAGQSAAPTPTAAPEPKQAGKEAFTGADTTSVCGPTS
ncbi:LytR family transcriptional regulator [Xylanimonas protaetiae]|uniref:LytR family transcriptional regulator n=2 Tax=Xylanimonas protaetiae TaxID=2509457 RepID=A0A4P6FBJ8_9MICO|nr:LytR family transcriptional regulator [Xylanimonas protaetiae]